jgi:hypothetical protein
MTKGFYPGSEAERDPIPVWGLCVLAGAWASAWTVLACVAVLT